MKPTRYFVIEPPEFTDVKWQLAATSEKSSFKSVLAEKKYSVVFSSKSQHAVLFAAGKLGINMVTIVGDKVHKASCKNVTYETSCIVLPPQSHQVVSKVVDIKFYNPLSESWCIPTVTLNKAQLKELKVPNALNSEFLILMRN